MIELCSLVVSDEYRQKGIGTKMILAAKNIAKENGFKIMTANARSNASSISLFKKMGFSHLYTLKNGIEQSDGNIFDLISFAMYL